MTQIENFSDDQKDTKYVVSERLTVTVNTFLCMHQSMGKVVHQLEEKGVIKKRNQATN
jgi:hypothetical protein